VIGACQFTLQASGDTVYASDASVLPVSNVPVLGVPIDWDHVTAEEVAAATRKALATADGNSRCALFYGGPKQFGYGRLTHLARGISEGCRDFPDHDRRLFIFSHNIANTLGRELRRHMPEASYLCLDEIEVGNLDYLDVGVAPPGESYLPVVVKSLIFQSTSQKPSDRA
jgi:ethanolamine utilization protein EutA